MSISGLPGDKFRCPACGFKVLTRSYPKCERCGKPLPAEWIRTKAEVQAEWAEAKKRENSLNLPGDSGSGGIDCMGPDAW